MLQITREFKSTAIFFFENLCHKDIAAALVRLISARVSNAQNCDQYHFFE